MVLKEILLKETLVERSDSTKSEFCVCKEMSLRVGKDIHSGMHDEMNAWNV